MTNHRTDWAEAAFSYGRIATRGDRLPQHSSGVDASYTACHDSRYSPSELIGASSADPRYRDNRFAEKGIIAATVRDISERAGILSGSLHHHFASKEKK